MWPLEFPALLWYISHCSCSPGELLQDPRWFGSPPATLPRACSSTGSFLLWGVVSNHGITGREVFRAIQKVSKPLRTSFMPWIPPRFCFPAFMEFQGTMKMLSANLFQPHVSHDRDICLLLPVYIFSGLDKIFNEDFCFYFWKSCVSL